MKDDMYEKLRKIDIPEFPSLAKGTSVPLPIGKLEAEIREVKEKEIRKEMYRHNWRIAVFSSLFGAAAGFVTSLLFWLIEK